MFLTWSTKKHLQVDIFPLIRNECQSWFNRSNSVNHHQRACLVFCFLFSRLRSDKIKCAQYRRCEEMHPRRVLTRGSISSATLSLAEVPRLLLNIYLYKCPLDIKSAENVCWSMFAVVEYKMARIHQAAYCFLFLFRCFSANNGSGFFYK